MGNVRMYVLISQKIDTQNIWFTEKVHIEMNTLFKEISSGQWYNGR